MGKRLPELLCGGDIPKRDFPTSLERSTINGPLVAPRTMSDTIKKGIGAVNKLQVVLNNINGVLYINGVQVHEFRGQPAEKTEARLDSSQRLDVHQQNEWRFLNITVVENQ